MKKQLYIAFIACTLVPSLMATSASSETTMRQKRVRISLDGETIVPATRVSFRANTVSEHIGGLALRNLISDDETDFSDHSDSDQSMLTERRDERPQAPVAPIAHVPGFIGNPTITKIILLNLKTDYPGLCRLAPISTGFDAFIREQMMMPTGKAWVAWVKSLIASGKKAETIFDEINAACLRCPNAIRELNAVEKSYFTEAPEELRLYNWDETTKRAFPIQEKDSLREQLKKINLKINNTQSGQLLRKAMNEQEKLLSILMPCVQELQPYAMASWFSNDGIFVAIDTLMLAATSETALKEWLRKGCGPNFVKEYCTFFKSLLMHRPLLYNCLVKQKGCETEKQTIQARMIANPRTGSFAQLPLGPTTFVAEDIYISTYNKKISDLRKIARGELLLGHTLTKEQLQKARYEIEDNLKSFIIARVEAINAKLASSTLAGPFKSMITARRAKLHELLLGLTSFNGTQHRSIAIDYIDAYEAHKTGPQSIGYLKKGAAFAHRTVEFGDVTEGELVVRRADQFLAEIAREEEAASHAQAANSHMVDPDETESESDSDVQLIESKKTN